MNNQLIEMAEKVKEILENNVERRIDIAEDCVFKNKKREYPVLFLNYGQDPLERKAVSLNNNKCAEDRLLDKLQNIIAPLEILNPVAPFLVLGVGPGTLAASFGMEVDAALGYTPRGQRSIDDVLREGVPSLNSGLLPEIKEDIDAIKAYTPSFFKMEKPDMQSVFNLCHMVLGTEAFILPFVEPEKFHSFMQIITEFYIKTDRQIKEWIGVDRAVSSPRRNKIIAECSCNLVSTDFYLENILQYDLQICKYYGETVIHPCSGPHVFYETIRNLPNVIYSEAGKMLAPMAAGCISIQDALSEIGNKNIVLSIGQELPKGKEFELISHDFDFAKTNNRLLFGYTGTHFRNTDTKALIDLHKKLDEYWNNNIVGGKNID